MFSIAILSSLVCGALASSRQSPPAGSLVVGNSLFSGAYRSISAAVAALNTTTTASQSIFIHSGIYVEQVYIPALKGPLAVYGQTADTTTYLNNTVNIRYNATITSAGSDDLAGTVRVWSQNTTFYNINIANTYGPGVQAIALSAQNTRQGYYACQLTGSQDTLYTNTGLQVYGKTLIVGATDFIFGRHAASWFDACDLRVLTQAYGYLTASGRLVNTDVNWFCLNNCTVATAANNVVADGAYFLGRPWSALARVTYQYTYLSPVINPVGWSIWNVGDPRTDNVTYEEYQTYGPGSVGVRANFSTELTAPRTIDTVLGADWATWVDRTYLSW